MPTRFLTFMLLLSIGISCGAQPTLTITIPAPPPVTGERPIGMPPAGQPVTPPEQPIITDKINEDDLVKLPKVSQPAALTEALMNLSKGSVAERVALLKRKALADLVFVKGGEFEMGDWGSYTGKLDTRPVHTVELSGFYIGRYQTTYAEFDVYTDDSKTPRTGIDEEDGSDHRYHHPLLPAGALWQRARDYCQWLGKKTGLPFDLPTEAQWEYAARSRGQNFAFPTDNGHVEHGFNVVGSKEHKRMISPITASFTDYSAPPVGMFPPNPLGLYDMTYGAMDWVLDWYAADYYAHSPRRNPQGPETGTEKVRRGWLLRDTLSAGVSAYRRSDDPELKPIRSQNTKPVIGFSFRCAVNSDKALALRRR
jgi:formylglycine-generating enzyme required for sulfatase activity